MDKDTSDEYDDGLEDIFDVDFSGEDADDEPTEEEEEETETEGEEPDEEETDAELEEADDDSPEEEEEAEEEEPELSPELVAEKKRREDSQKKFQEEHQARLEAQRELDALRIQLANASPAEAPVPAAEAIPLDLDSDEFNDKFDEDPRAAMAWALKEQAKAMQQQIGAMTTQREADREAAYVDRMNREENAMRAAHDDYDAVVTDYLAPLMESEPSLVSEWKKKGGTAEAAYKLGKKRKAFEEYQKDPEAHDARIREQALAEAKGEPKKIGTTLAGVTSTRDSKPIPEKYRYTSELGLD